MLDRHGREIELDGLECPQCGNDADFELTPDDPNFEFVCGACGWGFYDNPD